MRVFSCFFLLSICLPLMVVAQDDSLVINEIMVQDGLVDEDGDTSDWIEIRNRSQATVSLAGWKLSNREDNATPWSFPARELPSGGFLLVLASGKDRAPPENDLWLHCDFRLAQSSEFLRLIRPDGEISDAGFAPYPAQEVGFSYGFDSKGVLAYLPSPTPGGSNGDGVEGFVSPVVFSVEHGVFDAPFALELSCATDDVQILFTTDGSVPSLFSAEFYEEPLEIESTKVVRAFAQRAGFQPSKPLSQSYIFPADIIHQAANGSPPPGWPEGPVNGQDLYYQMHPAMPDRLGEEAMMNALRSLPTLSLSLDRKDLVDPADGIYVNAEERGSDWERPAFFEVLPTDDKDGVSVNCGIRIRGGISRGDEFPKHSLRLFFRKEYGDSKLNYHLFEDEGTDEFDNIDLRTSTNWDWASLGYFPEGASQNSLLRDISSRDTQGAMGGAYTRSRYYHLYINGLYWGIYMTQERSEASYAASYLDGASEDFDVIKINRGDGAHTEATDGNLDAWREIRRLALKHRDQPTRETLMLLQGLNPDGSDNVEAPELLDINQLIDYLLIIYWTANNDAPLSQWGDNDWSNNWYGIYNRGAGEGGFHFFVHDAENTYGIDGYAIDGAPRIITSLDRTGPYTHSTYQSGSLSDYNPQYIHQDLMANPDYRLRFADQVEKHCKNGGALTDDAAKVRFLRRRDQLAAAIPAHAARWGHRFADDGLTYDERTWATEVDSILDEFFPGRTEVLMSQLREDGLLSDIETPQFSQHGGPVEAGFILQVSADPGANEKLYYTVDGNDPRLSDGSIAPSAVEYDPASDEIPISTSVTVSARVHQTTVFDPPGTWSALAQARFWPGAAYAASDNLTISEIHYHPAPPNAEEIATGFDEASDFEFVEFYNPTSSTVILSGTRLADGVRYRFSDEAEIVPYGYAVLVSNGAAFRMRYGQNIHVAGEFSGNLSNGGERFALVNKEHEVLVEVNFDDAEPWPEIADGAGHSLSLIDLMPGGDLSEPTRWMASPEIHGSPGGPNNEEPTLLDSDGDGVSDKAEDLAGTDPNDSASYFRILSVNRDAEGIRIRWSSVMGKSYRLESALSLGDNVEWEVVSSHVADGEGVEALHVLEADAGDSRFYRVVVEQEGEDER